MQFCFMTASFMRWQVIPANSVVFCYGSNSVILWDHMRLRVIKIKIIMISLSLGTSQCAAQWYMTAASQSAGAAAEQAAELKSLRYDELSSDQLRAASLIGRNAVT